MRINAKDKKLLLYVIGILPLALVYFLMFVPFRENNDTRKKEIEELTQELKLRESWEKNQETYREETRRMQGEITQTLLAFPEHVLPEDVIVYAKQLEQLSDMNIVGIDIGTADQLYQLGEEDGTGTYLTKIPVVYTFTASYDDLKRSIRTIQSEDEKRGVEQVILSFDSNSGKIVGSMNVTMFSVQGGGTAYEEPEISGIPSGVSNIFGTTTHVTEEE